jgi:hypothetical protein
MSFYLRKSVKAGPFRFNLNKSGVGVSTGVPGFRVGTGPRGNYIRVGGGGVYYRATLGARQPAASEPAWRPPPPPPVADVLLEDITGSSAAELHPTGSGDLVEQLNEAVGRWRIFPWALSLLIVVLLAQPVVGAILLLPGVPGLVWLWFNDRARRTVVAFYDVNDAPAAWFQNLVNAAQTLANSQALWRVDAAGNVRTTYQYKVNSGASTIVSRKRAGASSQPPGVLATNIAVPTINAGASALYFLPDRVLVKDGKRFSDVSYTELQLQIRSKHFIESQRPPRDAAQVDTTWQYVNVKGGPDRRFKDNRQLPVMLYGELDLTSSSGFHWLLQCSQPAATEQIARALEGVPTTIEVDAASLEH